MDNCEHVLDIVADFVELVLDHGQHVRFLVMSREGLAVPGERIIMAPSLDEDEAVELFEVRLADAGGPPLGSDDLAVVATICQRLDGIPLALELAAARAAVVPLERLAAELDQRFDLLTGGRRRRRERHQTLRHTVEWSHDLLDETERRLFRLLAVFAGSFEFDAAVAVGTSAGLDEVEVVEALAGLCRKSLLQPRVGRDRSRYRYLEMIRTFADERLEAAGEVNSTMAWMTEWYIAWAERFPDFVRDLRSDDWVAEAEAEEPNLRRILVWAADHDDVDVICRFFAPFSPFVVWGGNRSGRWAIECLDETEVDGHPGAFHVLGLAAWAAYEQLDMESVQAFAVRAFEIAAANDEVPVAAWFANGLALMVGGRFEEVMSTLEAALAAAAGDHTLEASLMYGAGIYMAAAGGVLDRSDDDLAAFQTILDRRLLGRLGEVVHPFARAGVELHRDLVEAERLLQWVAEAHGTSDTFAGEVIRQDLARVAALRGNEVVAVAHGAHLIRAAVVEGRTNWLAIGGILLCGPLVSIGDAAFAAEVAAAAIATGLFEHFLDDLREPVLQRIRSSLDPDEFDARSRSGAAGGLAAIVDRLVDRLATLEALSGSHG